MAGGALSKVEIDEALIRNADFLRNFLEVGYRRFIKPERDWALQLRGVWILSRF